MSAPRTLTFFGGAATATGSMMLLEAAGARVLLDAGLFQGDVVQSEALNRELPLDPVKVDALLLSHGGLAAAGRAPQLVHHGFRGPIYATPATQDCAAVLLAEAALESNRPGREPLFTLPDVCAALAMFVGQPYRRKLYLRRNLDFDFVESGHTLGSASIEMHTGEGGAHRIVYSGSVGRPGSAIFRDPAPEPGIVDTLIIGSPFAHLRHESFAAARERLAELVRETAARGGVVFVPAASIGPVHEFVRALQQLYHQGAIPELPIWMDTPTPVCLPTVLRLHPEILVAAEQAYRQPQGSFDDALLRYGGTPQAREAIDALAGPAIVIAPPENCGTGRAAHHLRRLLGDARHSVIFLSFQEEGSVGRLLLDGAASVTCDGETVTRHAAVEPLTAFSGFADGEEMRAWIRALGGPVKRAFVVQGDDLAVAMMVTILQEEGVRDVIVPRQGESFPF